MAASVWADLWSDALSWLQVTSVFFLNWKNSWKDTKIFWRGGRYLHSKWLDDQEPQFFYNSIRAYFAANALSISNLVRISFLRNVVCRCSVSRALNYIHRKQNYGGNAVAGIELSLCGPMQSSTVNDVVTAADDDDCMFNIRCTNDHLTDIKTFSVYRSVH